MIYALPFSFCKLFPVRSDQMLFSFRRILYKGETRRGKALKIEGGIKLDQNNEWPLVACYVKLH